MLQQKKEFFDKFNQKSKSNNSKNGTSCSSRINSNNCNSKISDNEKDYNIDEEDDYKGNSITIENSENATIKIEPKETAEEIEQEHEEEESESKEEEVEEHGEKLKDKEEVFSLSSTFRQFARMQPTLPQTTGTADMDLPAVQSMDWLFKKEQIYLLAQFWQQRATLAEKEVNTLKEQLSEVSPVAAAGAELPTTTTPTADSIDTATAAESSVINATTTSTTPCIGNSGIITNNSVAPPELLQNKSPINNNNTKKGSSNHTPSSNNNNNNTNTIAISPKLSLLQLQHHHQNGDLSSPSPPLSDSGSTIDSGSGSLSINNLSSNSKLLLNNPLLPNNNNNNCSNNNNNNINSNNNNNNTTNNGNTASSINRCKMEDASKVITSMTADMKIAEQKDQNREQSPVRCENIGEKLIKNNNNNNDEEKTNNNNNNNNNTNNNEKSSDSSINKNNRSNNAADNNNRSVTPNSKNIENIHSNNKNTISDISESSHISSSSCSGNTVTSPKSLSEELAAKDKEIKALLEEVARLQALQETHIVQIQRLEERLEAKRQHIVKLETQIEKQVDVDEIKKDNSMRSLDISSPTTASAAPDAKQFQELILERTKALAVAQTEALKSVSSSSNQEGSAGSVASMSSTGATSSTTVTTIKTPLTSPAKTPLNNACKSQRTDIFPQLLSISSSSENKTKEVSAKSSLFNEAEKVLDEVDKDRKLSSHKPHNDNLLNSNSQVHQSQSAIQNRSLTSPLSLSQGAAPQFQNVEQFGSLLGEEIINNWRRGYEFPLPPPPPAPLAQSLKNSAGHLLPSLAVSPAAAVAAMAAAGFTATNSSPATTPTLSSTITAATSAAMPIPFQNLSTPNKELQLPPPPTGPSTTTLLSQLVNSTFSNNSLHADQTIGSGLASLSNSHQQQQQQQHHHSYHQDLDKSSSHHENSSAASTPNLQDGRRSTDDHVNGGASGGLTPISLAMRKSPSEDNNNTLGPLGPHVPPGFLPGLPFQFQDRGHFRYGDDLPMPPGSMTTRYGESLIPKGDPMEAKLQEMLRYNMDKYANQNLDTLHISRRVRELLSVHNIGQRLFAKYILGLSQGTVSELLSKPKPWDKLTEKGRDSYRKMHAWGCDDNAVLLLKSLIPKKGQDSGMPQYGGRSDDSMSDDRIAHILSEASNLMKAPPNQGILHHTQTQQQLQHQQQVQQASQQQQQQQQQQQSQQQQQLHQQREQRDHQQQQHQQQHHHQQQQQREHQHHSLTQEDTHSNEDSKSPHNQCNSPFYKDPMQRRLKPEDMSQEKVARIYQEELAKLMTRAPRDSFPSGGMPPANAALPIAPNQMSDENIRMALEAYHRELTKLQPTGGALPNFPNLPGLLALQQQAFNGAQDLSVPKEKSMKPNGQSNSSSSERDLNDSGSTKETSNTPSSEDALRHSSAFSLVRPKQEPPGTPVSGSNTNPTPTAPSPLGNSILPPAMTPTDDFSSAASPLQRMASITNSLITQPPVTPHHNTQQRPMKAVLPPITQQQFDMFNNLNTEDIVRRVKEALSQYSISQRLFGESVLGLSQGSVSDLLARPKPWHMLTQKGREPFIRMKMFLEDENAVHKLVASQYKIAPEKLMRTGNYSGSPQIPPGINSKMVHMPKMMNDLKMPEPQHLMQMQAAAAMSHIPTSQHQQGMLLTPPGLPPHHAINLPPANEKKPMMMPVHSPQQNNAIRTMHQHMSPTVYEMAALTHDLDTQVITTKIKEALLANNIGQKIFGEAVLGLSQGSVSELLSKPKPWHMLSIKGREPFIRMQLWLSDANNVERLQALKNERREASKRRRSTGPGTQDNSSDTSSNDTADFYTSSPGPGSVGSTGAPPNKKQRVLFSEEQKEALRLAFALDPYPNVATIEFLANELGLATRTITNWFHNHRMRLKQQVPHGTPSEPVPSRENQSGTPFDPVQFRILLNQRLMELQKERMGLSGVSLPYPPYFAANPNLAALISRGLIPGGDAPDLAALNNAFKEQMSGLDLSMSSLKRERDDFEDVDGEADSHISDTESIDESDTKSDNNKETPSTPLSSSQSRTSRRKPAAPQWVNPDWQDDVKGGGQPSAADTRLPTDSPVVSRSNQEVIINGVCVMQQEAADYSRKSGPDETVRVDPSGAQEDDASDNEDENETNRIEGDTQDSIKSRNLDRDEGENDNLTGNKSDVLVKQEINESGEDKGDRVTCETPKDDDDASGSWNY